MISTIIPAENNAVVNGNPNKTNDILDVTINKILWVKPITAPSKIFKIIIIITGKIMTPRNPKFINASENNPLFARAVISFIS